MRRSSKKEILFFLSVITGKGVMWRAWTRTENLRARPEGCRKVRA